MQLILYPNVRKKIIKEHLIDPAFFEEMSKLLATLIKERKSKAISYTEYLKKIAELVKQVNEGKGDDTPEVLKTIAQRALYNNLDKNEDLAMQIDNAVKISKRNNWRGNLPKEREIKAELYKILKDVEKVESIFKIIKEQKEY